MYASCCTTKFVRRCRARREAGRESLLGACFARVWVSRQALRVLLPPVFPPLHTSEANVARTDPWAREGGTNSFVLLAHGPVHSIFRKGNPMNDNDRLLTAEQCADYLNLTVKTVRTMIARGEIPAYSLAHDSPKRPTYRVRASALDSVLTPVKAGNASE